jgi:hypothetical protein
MEAVSGRDVTPSNIKRVEEGRGGRGLGQEHVEDRKG